LDEIEIPREGFSYLQKQLIVIKKELEEIDKELVKASTYKKQFVEYRKEILKMIEFYKVRSGVSSSCEICCIQGFVPLEEVVKINKLLRKKGWATVSQDPDDGDEVPTLIRNPKWVGDYKANI